MNDATSIQVQAPASNRKMLQAMVGIGIFCALLIFDYRTHIKIIISKMHINFKMFSSDFRRRDLNSDPILSLQFLNAEIYKNYYFEIPY